MQTDSAAQKMEQTRLEFLRETLQVRPEDTFVRYGLAMELARSGEPTEAWEHFQYLLTHHPEYSPTYYQAGMFLSNHGRREEARKVFAQGIEVSGRQGNSHAQGELQAALDDLVE
jgi:Flp pilus assembly protein TadD